MPPATTIGGIRKRCQRRRVACLKSSLTLPPIFNAEMISELTITEGNKQKKQGHSDPASLFMPSINQKV
jgi:hypothetical protein